MKDRWRTEITVLKSIGAAGCISVNNVCILNRSKNEWLFFRRVSIGIADNLIRLSVGIESAEDIIADIDAALNSI